MEIIGDYEYNSANRLGLGAFAIVFKGRSRKVCNFNKISLDYNEKNVWFKQTKINL